MTYMRDMHDGRGKLELWRVVDKRMRMYATCECEVASCDGESWLVMFQAERYKEILLDYKFTSQS